MKVATITTAIAIMWIILAGSGHAQSLLKVEYAETPIGIDVLKPRFSWQTVSSGDRRGCRQTAYRLIVKSETGQTVWDSKKIKSDMSLNIEYAGKPLSAATRYDWTLTVWDDRNQSRTAQSWFETGLMNPSLSAWDGAKWIGGGDGDLPLYSQYLSVFRLNYTVRLDKAARSTRAAFVYGANDDRLADRNKNLFHLENAKNGSYISVELDIAPLSSGGNAQLNIYRVGYTPDDKKDTPYQTYPVPQTIIHDGNKYGQHTVYLSSVFGNTQIHINGSANENRIADLNLNPMGKGGDYIAFPVLADIGFDVPPGQTATFSNVEIRNFGNPANVLASWINEEKLSGTFRVFDPDRNAMPELQTTFKTAQSKIVKARLYITARGIYEAYLNGKRIGNDYFNPGLTQYNKTHLYQTYDVTDYIRPGENTLGALLGEGWWSGNVTYTGENWNFFGDRQSLLAKLVVTYPDGTTDVTVTNPSTWVYSADNPVVYGSFFQGEVYDATKESQPKQWKPAEEITLEGNARHPAGDYASMALVGQYGQTVKPVKELTARSVEEVRPGVFVYDMGQNMVGVPQIRLSGMKAGRKIVLRYAEVKYPDLPEYRGNVGMIMLENIRAAMAQDIYITKGGDETISPRFTFHGYRFIEITGIDKPLPPDAVKGSVLSSLDKLSSYYETSDSRINRLWENITWSAFGNFLSIPTDCPQRNERMGWSGDISVFSRTACYVANIPQFLKRHLAAMRDVQGQDGRFPDVAPIGGGFGGILWGSAGITVAWESYRQFGDRQMLAEHYGAMKEYMEYLIRKINPQSGILKEKDLGTWSVLGDWLCLKDVTNEKALLWESCLIYDLEQMSKMAAILNKSSDAERYRNLCAERKAFYNKNYMDANTGKTVFRENTIDTQSSYALAFAFNIINGKNREAALKNFTASITRENKTNDGTVCPPYSLMTGFIGTAWINKALTDNGHADMAYRLLQQTTYPSWLYPVEQGATTIWERLNSYTHTNGFGGNNGMNSFNHYSFGAVGAWMYNCSLGIECDENSPGFKHFILQPHPDPTGRMTYAKGHYESMYGRIESSWRVAGNDCLYRFTVPANTTATLYLKAPSADAVVEGEKPFASSPGVKYIGEKDGKHVFELLSGSYDIRVKEAEKIKYSAYLFAYFGGSTDGEAIRFAVSRDGYNYKALNGNRPIISSALISDKGGVRDPHILRGIDGKTFYMTVTDMRAAQGWNSNHGIVLLKSTDLIHWSHSRIDIKATFPEFATIDRAWAPQTIYDPTARKYMLYWSMHTPEQPRDIIHYAYANADFTALEGVPQVLFHHPQSKSCIDGDIICKDGQYHLFFKTEGDGNGIKKAVSNSLTGGYTLIDRYLQQTDRQVEGSCVFKLTDREKYILMYDVYTSGRYQFTESSDLENFTNIDSLVSMDFHPRHGTVIPLTEEEYARLVREWGRELLSEP